MSIGKPSNHVTRGIAKRYASEGRPCPDLTRNMLEWLEANYPPRCLQTNETVEDHLRYAGKVDLIAGLRAQFDAHLEDNETADAENILADAERAT